LHDDDDDGGDTIYKRLTLNLIVSDRKDDPSFIEANMRKLYCTAAGWAVCDMMDLPSLGLIASVMAPKKRDTKVPLI